MKNQVQTNNWRKLHGMSMIRRHKGRRITKQSVRWAEFRRVVKKVRKALYMTYLPAWANLKKAMESLHNNFYTISWAAYAIAGYPYGKTNIGMWIWLKKEAAIRVAKEKQEQDLEWTETIEKIKQGKGWRYS